MRDPDTEARDAWMLDLWNKGTSLGQIVRQLAKQSENWMRIETERGVKKAIMAYAKRHGLPAPSPRKAGRQRGN